MQLFAYSWKLPAYSGAFLLAVDNSSFLLAIGAFSLTSLAFLLAIGVFFAYNGKVLLISALRDCKQRSLTVSKKAPTARTKAPAVSAKSFNCFWPPGQSTRDKEMRGEEGAGGTVQGSKWA